MSKTTLLPTATAVRLAWALSGKFSNDETSRMMATFAETDLKNIEDKAAVGTDDEKSYVYSATVTIRSSLRSLETVYKGRELNFSENEKLREANLESIKDSLNFGNTSKDLLKSLPTMTIGAASGVTVAKAIGIDSNLALWAIGIALAAVGYLLNFIIVRQTRKRKQRLYVLQDYDRGLYYSQYVNRVKLILAGLFLDVESIHYRVFKENFEENVTSDAIMREVEQILAGVNGTSCKYIHKHMVENKITPELWTTCESGQEDAVKSCPFYGK